MRQTITGWVVYAVVAAGLFYVTGGLAELGGLIWYAFVLGSLYWVPQRLTGRRWVPYAFLLAGLAWPFAEYGLRTIALNRTLETVYDGKMGHELTRKAEGVEGFFVAHENGCGPECAGNLQQGRYAFVEAEATHRQPDHLVEEPGRYRFTLQPRGHRNCQTFEYYVRRKDKRHNRYRNTCIAVDRITDLRSRYQISNNSQENNFWFGEIIQTIIEVKNIENNAILYRYYYYLFYPYWHWMRSALFSGTVIPEGARQLSIEQVLVPASRAAK